MNKYALFFPVALALAACNLEKEIEIELPEYQSQLALECYLEPGAPFRLSLTKSAAYFDPFPAPDNIGGFLQEILVPGAKVQIRHRNRSYTLSNILYFDPAGRRLYNYFSPTPVPLDTVEPFSLEVITEDGKTITATTRILPVVPIDSAIVQFKEGDTLARILTYFTDPSDRPNFFRRVLHLNSLDSIPLQDFTVDDRFVEKTFVFGSGYDYKPGDTLISTIYHIDEPYFRFQESLQRAVFGNGNPFAQASPLISNLDGSADAIGIFTGLRFSRVYSVVKKQ
jgi:hypothetical protein